MIDPTSKDDPKFKELVKVRSTSVSAFWAVVGGLLGRVGGWRARGGPRSWSPGSGKLRREGWGPRG